MTSSDRLVSRGRSGRRNAARAGAPVDPGVAFDLSLLTQLMLCDIDGLTPAASWITFVSCLPTRSKATAVALRRSATAPTDLPKMPRRCSGVSGVHYSLTSGTTCYEKADDRRGDCRDCGAARAQRRSLLSTPRRLRHRSRLAARHGRQRGEDAARAIGPQTDRRTTTETVT